MLPIACDLLREACEKHILLAFDSGDIQGKHDESYQYRTQAKATYAKKNQTARYQLTLKRWCMLWAARPG
jgi:hypothetical protein